MTRYTKEAIDALVAAAERLLRTATEELHDAEHAHGVREVRAALRPFTSEPSSWDAWCRELWGEKWRI